MSDEFNEELEKNDEETNTESNSASAKLEEEFGEIDPQLFIALTSRWRRENGSLAIGVSKNQLRNKTGLTLLELETTLEDFGRKAKRLGLELISYVFENEEWYCLRSIYVVPNELTLDEQAVLGTIIFIIERKSDRRIREEDPIS